MDTLLRFTIENFRSIAERKSIVLIPDSHVEELAENVAVQGEHRYFRTAAIYGANSSGKSNVVLGLAMMKHLVDSSVKMNNGEALTYDPFALNAEKAQSPTLYELDFLTGGEHYRYGFSHTAQNICEEWLIRIDEAGKATKLFDRDEEGIGVNEADFAEGKGLEERTNDNRLFLSLVGQLGGKISNLILAFFSFKLDVLSGLKTEHYQSITEMYLLEQAPGVEALLAFLFRAQLGFSDLGWRVQELSPEEQRANARKGLSGEWYMKVLSEHGIYDNEGNRIGNQEFDFNQMESAGTQKLFDMAGPIFASLYRGGVLMIDELDAKMHPLLTQELSWHCSTIQSGILTVRSSSSPHTIPICSLPRFCDKTKFGLPRKMLRSAPTFTVWHKWCFPTAHALATRRTWSATTSQGDMVQYLVFLP